MTGCRRSLRRAIGAIAVVLCLFETFQYQFWSDLKPRVAQNERVSPMPSPSLDAAQPLTSPSLHGSEDYDALRRGSLSTKQSEGSTQTTNQDALSNNIVPKALPTTTSSRQASELSAITQRPPKTNDQVKIGSRRGNEQERLLDQYKQWHSKAALVKDFDNPKRKFALAMFSCPMAAGNRYHQFSNVLVHAMMTNRTVLYKYMDQDTCWAHWDRQKQRQHHYNSASCRTAFTEEPCLNIIEFPSWIPRWDDWAPQLGFTLADATVIDYWAIDNYDYVGQMQRDANPIRTPLKELPKVDTMPDRLVDFPVLVGRYIPKNATIQNQLYATNYTKSVWPVLFRRGPSYLYGFFMKQLFPLRELHRISPPTLAINTFTIAVHSRHPIESYTGQDISMEAECIAELLRDHKGDRPCHVCLMSDRPLTIHNLHQWIAQNTTCTSFSVNHSSETFSNMQEQGPHAGLGFLQELDVCGQANAFVGNSHGATSSMLLESSVVYREGRHYIPRCSFHRLQPWEVRQSWDRTKPGSVDASVSAIRVNM